jgi:MYXO-CTERM domain-containing protein
MEDVVLRFSNSLRMLLLVAMVVLGLAVGSSAGVLDDTGVVPEPTSVLIWLGLMGVVAAASGRRGRE